MTHKNSHQTKDLRPASLLLGFVQVHLIVGMPQGANSSIELGLLAFAVKFEKDVGCFEK